MCGAKRFPLEAAPGVNVVVPHPHDVLLAKLERMDPKDQLHLEKILASFPLSRARFDELVSEYPAGSRDAERDARSCINADALRLKLS